MKIQEITWVKKNKAEVFFCFVFPFFLVWNRLARAKVIYRKLKKNKKTTKQVSTNLNSTSKLGFNLFSGVIGRKCCGKQSSVLQDTFVGFWSKVSQEGRKWKRWYKVSALIEFRLSNPNAPLEQLCKRVLPQEAIFESKQKPNGSPDFSSSQSLVSPGSESSRA